jgi:hypothetical protein
MAVIVASGGQSSDSIGDRAIQHEVFQILIRQIAQDREIDIILSKTLGVLGQASFSSQSANRQDPSSI